MLTNTNHRATDQRTTDASDPTQHPTPLDRRPYWNQTSAAFSAALWLPAGTADRGSLINTAHGWTSKTAAHSWFSPTASRPLTQTCPSSTRQPQYKTPPPTRTTAGASQQARRIQVYPDRTQKLAITTWLTASRWTYNLTVEILQSGIPAVWKHIASMVMPKVKALHPEWDSVPYQVKRTAVRDACRAMSNIKTFNLELKDSQAHGNRADEEFAELATAAARTPSSPATYRTTP